MSTAPIIPMETVTRVPKRVKGKAERPAWYLRPKWRNHLQQHLWLRTRRKFKLSVGEHCALGATNFTAQHVQVNPTKIAFPPKRVRRYIRHSEGITTALQWQQKTTLAILDHECGHVNHTEPQKLGPLLHWLDNVLDDQRIERRQIERHPELRLVFDRLGDALLAENRKPTADLLGWCLLWRWLHDREDLWGTDRDPMDIVNADWELWQNAVRPLVERAWAAETSEEVTDCAREILAILRRDESEAAPIIWIIGCDFEGRRGDGVDGSVPPPAVLLPLPPPPPEYDGDTEEAREMPPLGLNEAPPEPVLEEVENAAKDLAKVLRPITPNMRILSHPSRGEYNYERDRLDHSTRPFDFKQQPAEARTLRIRMLIDFSGSMGSWNYEGCNAYGATRAAMLFNRACEVARVPLSIWGFRESLEPEVVQGFDQQPDDLRVRRRIAGITGGGNEILNGVFRSTIEEFKTAPEQAKWIIFVIDGRLTISRDPDKVKALIPQAKRAGIRLLPIVIGKDSGAVECVNNLFGFCLHAPDAIQLARKLQAWARAAF